MKIKKAELLTALKAVQPGIANKEIVEQSMSFVFSDGRVFTYNDEIAISHPIDIDLDGAVPAKELFALVSKVKGEDLNLTTNGVELCLVGGKSKAGLRLETIITLPLEELGLQDDWIELPEKFCDAVQRCLFSASKDETKLVLTCIHIIDNLVESCDNHRVTQFDMGEGSELAFPKELLIPASSAKGILNSNPIEYAVTKGWLHFRNEKDVTYSCRYFDERYPDFSPFLECKGETVNFPSTLNEILDRANVLSDGERVSIYLEKDLLTVATENEAGWFEETETVDYKGKPIEFDIQPEFMKSILKFKCSAVVSAKTLRFDSDDFIHVIQLLSPKKK